MREEYYKRYNKTVKYLIGGGFNMKIISYKVFRGRNIYSHMKCVRLNLDLKGYGEIPNKEIYNFNDSLIRMLPELNKHRLGINEDRGFIKRLTQRTYLAHVSEHIILTLQNMIGLEISYGKTRMIHGDKYYVIYQYEYKNVAIEAGNIAIDLINSLINKEQFDLDLRLNRLKDILKDEQLGVDTLNIFDEAKVKEIPVLKLGENNMFQLGYGRYSKTIQGTAGSDTKGVSAHISQDKLFNDIIKSFPLVAVTGTNGKTTTTRLIAHILFVSGYTVGMTTTGGIYIDGKCILKGDTTGPKSAFTLLTNKHIDAAVLETARGGIIRGGLCYDLADVAVITNITEDHLGIDEVETLEDLAKVKALVGEAVKINGYVVINGDDKISISILGRFKCNLIIFSKYKSNEIMLANIKNGGYGIYMDEDNLIVQKGTKIQKLIEIDNIAITMKGIIKYNIENAMAACGAAIGLGVNHDIIRKSLMSFYCNKDQNPGRFNIYYVNDITVVLDYGHNIASYRSVFSALKNIKHNKLIGVIGAPGDRLDSFIMEVGRCAGENLDYIFIKENEDKRGRSDGAVADIVEKGILKSKFNSTNIKKIIVETEAFKAALDYAKPKDIIIIFIENPKAFIDIMREKTNELKSDK